MSKDFFKTNLIKVNLYHVKLNTVMEFIVICLWIRFCYLKLYRNFSNISIYIETSERISSYIEVSECWLVPPVLQHSSTPVWWLGIFKSDKQRIVMKTELMWEFHDIYIVLFLSLLVEAKTLWVLGMPLFFICKLWFLMHLCF